MPISTGRSLLVIAAVSGTVFLTRLLPFLLFPGGRKIPPLVGYLGRVLPPAVIGMLVVYCFKTVELTRAPYGAPELLTGAAVILLHVWKRNNLLSIGVGTVLYMFFVQAVFTA